MEIPQPIMDTSDTKLLLVDDTPGNLDALEVMLEPTGCCLVRAQSGDEALLALLQHDFAAIILDIRMPGMGGLDLAKLIKQRRRSQHIPILFLTAHLVDRDDVLTGYGVGAVDYLSKPVNGDILRSKVGVFVELHRKTHALAELNKALQDEIAERTRMQRDVERANEELEARVRERTAALTKAQQRADTANQAKDEFLAMLGHELRNPLAPMVTALELLRLRGVQSPEQDVLERQVRHLVRMVDDLLDVSRITSGKIEMQRWPIELGEVVTRAMEIASPLLEQRRHRVEVLIARDGLGIDADVDRMAQVFANLLTNAAKYSERGSRIVVRGQRVGALVQLSVEDEGIGIVPEMLAGVFDAFVQQPQTLDRSRGGLGLGLAIVRSLVTQHGGTVRAASAGAGHGTTFYVNLPAVEVGRPVVGATLAPRAPDPERARTCHILVVDDNHDAADMLRTALENLGYTVQVAHDGPSALQICPVFRPDVALLDIGLPVMDGYELAQRLRAMPNRSPALKLVAVTGYGQDADRERAARAGFDQHLVKPIDLARLERVVESYIAVPLSDA